MTRFLVTVLATALGTALGTALVRHWPNIARALDPDPTMIFVRDGRQPSWLVRWYLRFHYVATAPVA
jgi:hypothetical protein